MHVVWTRSRNPQPTRNLGLPHAGTTEPGPVKSGLAAAMYPAHASVWDGRGQAYRLDKQDLLGHLLFNATDHR